MTIDKERIKERFELTDEDLKELLVFEEMVMNRLFDLMFTELQSLNKKYPDDLKEGIFMEILTGSLVKALSATHVGKDTKLLKDFLDMIPSMVELQVIHIENTISDPEAFDVVH